MISLSTLKVLSERVNMKLELHGPLFCANFSGVTLLRSIGKLGRTNFCPSLLGELEDRKVMVGAAVVVFLHTLVNIREYILVRELHSGQRITFYIFVKNRQQKRTHSGEIT